MVPSNEWIWRMDCPLDWRVSRMGLDWSPTRRRNKLPSAKQVEHCFQPTQSLVSKR